MPQKMTDSELAALLSAAENQAAIYNGDFMAENEKFLNAYLAKKEGDFAAVPDHSSVVSTDIQDVIESDMPSLARIFMGSGDVISFQPNTDNEKEIQEAEEKTKYVNWIVRNQPESFQTLHAWLKGAGIQKNSVVKFFMEELKEVEEVEYTGVDAEEIADIMQSLVGAEVDKVKVEITEQAENVEAETFDIKFRVTRIDKKVKIINIPPESFLITKNATCITDAELTGDTVRKTRGELLADGFDRDLIDSLATIDGEKRRASNIKSIRDGDQGGADRSVGINNWASENVEISDLYVKIDFDGDGIAERRHVMKSGNKILINEYFNRSPYASLSAILMPHKAIGRSRAEVTYQTQLQKTALLRGMNDNIYMVNNPRNVVHDDVDFDDMLTVRTNGIVRLDEDSKVLPAQAVATLQIPYTGDKTLQVMQYVDGARAQNSGSMLANQGLNADAIGKETATRFAGVEKAGGEKIELIARNYAETGFRDLYEGIAWLVSRFQDTNTEFRVLGKALTVNPSGWKYNHHVESNVGSGAGNNEKLVESLQGIYAIQGQLKSQGSVLTDEADIYNTLKRIIDGLGLPRVDEFFNNPDEPVETLKAENEILNATLVEMQEQMQALQNPLAEAEQIKAQAKLVEAQGTAQVKLIEMQQSQEQFNREQAKSNREFQEKMALQLTELELKFNTDVPGALT